MERVRNVMYNPVLYDARVEMGEMCYVVRAWTLHREIRTQWTICDPDKVRITDKRGTFIALFESRCVVLILILMFHQKYLN